MLTRALRPILLVASALVLLSSGSMSHGTSIVKSGETPLRADVVLDVRVIKQERLSVEGDYCGTRYTAAVDRVLKGDRSLKTIVFGRAAGLRAGAPVRVYLVYLTAVSELSKVNPQLSVEPPSEHESDMFYCDGLVPGYEMVGRKPISRENK